MNRGRTDNESEQVADEYGEPFLQRFHRLKTEARQSAAMPSSEAEAAEAEPPELAESAEAGPTGNGEPTDADMPPVEALDYNADFSGFMSPRVSEGLRRVALRKLFHSAELNIVDGLDEYAEDFTQFEALGDIITADMKHQIEVAARKQAEALKQALPDSGEEPAAQQTAALSGEDAPDPSVETPTDIDDRGGTDDVDQQNI